MNHPVRNFAIISHIDHGKSTLADCFLRVTNTIPERYMRERFLDKLDLEREHGVTIKLQAVRMRYVHNNENYILNLIDTPGHVDFGYEVSRALAACEGALLLVDATQGVQAQTLSTALKALDANLTLIPVVNKIDLPNANVGQAVRQFHEYFGFHDEEVLRVSAKTAEGVSELLAAVIERTPPPQGNPNNPLRALIFDSQYTTHRGVTAFVKVVDGVLTAQDKLYFMATDTTVRPLEVGVTTNESEPRDALYFGEVGYIATGLKEISRCQVGDTVTTVHPQLPEPLPGYQQIRPVVYASFYPVDSSSYEEFRASLEKLALNDAALEYRSENSTALGFGFRIGFLGSFHADIVRERLEREFNLDLIVTAPTVEYEVSRTDGSELIISSPLDLPDPSSLTDIREPWVSLTLLTPAEYLASLTQVIGVHRGNVLSVQNVRQHLLISAEIPLAELIVDFHDEVKSITSGFASYDYERNGYRSVDAVRLDIVVHHEVVPPLSRLVVRTQAERIGRQMVESLKEVLPRQQFAIPLQAAIGGRILARETLPAYRKDVTAKLYGGDRTRKDKLLKKQAAGKKRMRTFGTVEVPKEAFLAVLKSRS